MRRFALLLGAGIAVMASCLTFSLAAGSGGKAWGEGVPTLPSRPVIPMGVQTFGNDTENDCVLAAVGNLVALWNPGGNRASAAASVQATWQAFGAPDAGLYPEDVLTYWKTNPIAGYTIDGFTREAATQVNIEATVEQDSGAFLEVEFGSWYTDPVSGTWTTTNDVGLNPNYVHEVVVSNFNEAGVTLISWGGAYTASWGWVAEHAVDLDLIQAPFSR